MEWTRALAHTNTPTRRGCILHLFSRDIRWPKNKNRSETGNKKKKWEMGNHWCACHRRAYLMRGMPKSTHSKRKQDSNGKSIIWAHACRIARSFFRLFPPVRFFFRSYFRRYIRNSTSKHPIFVCMYYVVQPHSIQRHPLSSHDCTPSPLHTRTHRRTRPLRCRWGWSYIALCDIMYKIHAKIFASYDCACVDNDVDDDDDAKWKMVRFCVAGPC